jgi:hypothetical protein
MLAMLDLLLMKVAFEMRIGSEYNYFFSFLYQIWCLFETLELRPLYFTPWTI